jgi:hypothetical protein
MPNFIAINPTHTATQQLELLFKSRGRQDGGKLIRLGADGKLDKSILPTSGAGGLTSVNRNDSLIGDGDTSPLGVSEEWLAQFGKWISKADLNAIRNIPATWRYDGLMVYDKSSKVMYQFRGGVADTDLTPVASVIEEAPTDNKLYARKNAGWSEIGSYNGVWDGGSASSN